LGGSKGIWPVKIEWCGVGVVICLEQYGPADATATAVSCFSKIQIGFTFLLPAHPVVLDKGVCVCYRNL